MDGNFASFENMGRRLEAQAAPKCTECGDALPRGNRGRLCSPCSRSEAVGERLPHLCRSCEVGAPMTFEEAAEERRGGHDVVLDVAAVKKARHVPTWSMEVGLGEHGQHDVVVDFDRQDEDRGAFLILRAAWLKVGDRRRDVAARLSPALKAVLVEAAEQDYSEARRIDRAQAR